MKNPIIVTREELYDQVWSEPTSKLAPKFGLSDVGLSKVCKKHQIPKPPLGHWAKIAHGKSAPQTPLPAITDPSLNLIKFHREPFDLNSRILKPNYPEIEVPQFTGKYHQLISKARKAIESERPAQNGVLEPRSDDCLGVKVTKKSLPRALRILDALIKHLESECMEIKSDRTSAIFVAGKDSVKITLSEKVDRKEKQNAGRYWKNYEYTPTGRLRIQINEWGENRRMSWADGKKQRLEDLLGQIAFNIYEWVDINKLKRLNRECEKRQGDLAREVSEIITQQIESDKKRASELEANVNAWVKAEQIRTYLGALKSKKEKGQLIPIENDSFYKWYLWAHWYADTICPMTIQK